MLVFNLWNLLNFDERIIGGQLSLRGRCLQEILTHACLELRVVRFLPVAVDGEQFAVLDFVILDVHYFLVLVDRPLFLLLHLDVLVFVPAALGFFSLCFECFVLLNQLLGRHDVPRQVIDFFEICDFDVHHLFDEIPVLFGVDCAAVVEYVVGQQLRVQNPREIYHVEWLVHETTILVLVRGQILLQVRK